MIARTFLVSLTCLALLCCPAALSAGTVAPYEWSGSDTSSISDLYEKAYGERVDPIAALGEMNQFNAFLAVQDALTEMMIDPAESQKSRDYYRGLNNNDYMYWNKQMSMMPRPHGSSSSDKVAQTCLIPESVGMTGKNMFLPDKETLQKALDILKSQKDLAERLRTNDPPITQEEFEQQVRQLDRQFLENAARELSTIKELSQGGKVYGMGFTMNDAGEYGPLELNSGLIESSLRRLGVPIPDPAALAATDAPDAPSRASVADAPAAITVKQKDQVVQEMDRDYQTFAEGFSDEASRTKAEIDLDMFRMRVRPQDVKPGQKIYDPYMTHELQSGGGLSLPSYVPKDEEQP
jgi:hypothetical protein